MVDSKQDMLGAINNAVVAEFVAKGILVSPDPANISNGNITRHLADHLSAKASAKLFGDGNSKDIEIMTLNDLVAVINNRRTEAGMKQIDHKSVIVAVMDGWDKTITQQQEKSWTKTVNEQPKGSGRAIGGVGGATEEVS